MQHRIDTLARRFPSLKNALGLKPFSPHELDAWGALFDRGTHERCSVKFVLFVCDPFESWRSGPFNVFEALISWDDAHRDVFIDWARSPWWR